jgi:transposase
LAEIGAR